jgi:hypothetical protein
MPWSPEFFSAPVLPQAGVAVYVRGDSGKLAAVRTYDDIEPLVRL